MKVEGIILAVGRLAGEVIGAHIIVIQNEVAYSHLAAFSEVAYKSIDSTISYIPLFNGGTDENISRVVVVLFLLDTLLRSGDLPALQR
jgi:hypothetical protein